MIQTKKNIRIFLYRLLFIMPYVLVFYDNNKAVFAATITIILLPVFVDFMISFYDEVVINAEHKQNKEIE